MPRDANGNYSLPSQYFVQNGDTVLPVQHNPPFEDVAQALTNSLAKDGRTVMTGNLQMGGNRITNAAPGEADSDVATVGQAGRKASFKTVAALLADTTLSYTTGPARVSEGDIIEAQGFRYEVAASDALAFDPDTAADGYNIETAGGVKLRVLRQGGNTLQPEQWNATGDGVADDYALVQACVDYAESMPHSKVVLAPLVTYGVSDTIQFGAGAYDTIFEATAVRTSLATSYTFVKLADVPAWGVIDNNGGAGSFPTLVNLSVRGRGDEGQSPSNWTPDVETTPGAVLHGKTMVIAPAFEYCGGLIDSTAEENTDGYALGIIQPVGGNCNYINVEGAAFYRCAGDGVFINREETAITNCNAIRVSIRNYSSSSGYAINAEHGFRNDYFVQHISPGSEPTLKGVFRLNYVENTAWCQYAEGGTAIGVDFGDSGNRNEVKFNDAAIFGSIYTSIRQNTVIDINVAKTYIGDSAAGGKQKSFLGRGGVVIADSDKSSGAYLCLGSVETSGTGRIGLEVVGSGTGPRTLQRFINDNGEGGTITLNGTTTTYNTTSDATRKVDDGLITFEQARAILDLIQFHQFRWKADGKEDWGVFAQELYEIYPAAVTRGGWRDPATGDWLDEDNGTEYQPWGVDYSKLVTVLGACLQGVIVRQDEMDARIAALE